jgi:hypothetical protein
MTFSERMMELLDQGVAASKELALKAGAKAQELGEKGMLMLDIKQLEYQAQKLMGRLGNETYRVFAEKNQKTLKKDAPEIEAILTDIARVRESIEQKETELRNKRA